MIRVRLTTPVHAPAEHTWNTVSDWPAHSAWIPFTQVTVLNPEHPAGIGTQFVGRTGISPLHFDDPMTVTTWTPPTADHPVGECTVSKDGRVVTGTAGFTVTPTGPTSSTLTWFEDIEVTPARLTRLVEPLLTLLARIAFAKSVTLMAAHAAATYRPADDTAPDTRA